MSPELEAAIAASEHETGPAYKRGRLVVGPQEVNYSDVLAKLIDEAKGKLTEEHYAPSPEGQRKRYVDQRRQQAERAQEGETGRRPMPVFSPNAAHQIRQRRAG